MRGRDTPASRESRPGSPPGRLAALLAAAVALALPVAPTGAEPAAADGPLATGLYRSGVCGGALQIVVRGQHFGCTHGPDPAPRSEDGLPGPGDPFAGEEPPPLDCHGDGVSGHRVQPLYVHVDPLPSSHAQAAPEIERVARGMARLVEESAARAGGFRTLRFAMPGCELSVPAVKVSPAAGEHFAHLIAELVEQGYDDPERDYVAFVSKATAGEYCGMGQRDGQYARVDCWNAETALHELAHNLSAVDPSAANSTRGYHCTDEYDVMCYPDAPDFPAMREVCPDEARDEALLDCGNDDYFHTDPAEGSFLARNPHLNVADRPYMAGADGESVTYMLRAPWDYRGPTYRVRLHGGDDELTAYGLRTDGSQVRLFRVGPGRDREFDVTGALLQLAGGDPVGRVRLVATSSGGGHAYGFRITRGDGSVAFEESGAGGAGTGTVYDRTVALELNFPPHAGWNWQPSWPKKGEPVTFRSDATDRDGRITRYEWDLDGDGEFDDATGQTVEHRLTFGGERQLGVRVTDDAGATATERSLVAVAAEPPVASFEFTPAEPDAGEPVEFTGRGSDPDGSVRSYAWDLDGDGEFDDGSGASATFTYAQAWSSYAAALKVVDEDGLEAVAQRVVEVREPPSNGTAGEPSVQPGTDPAPSDASEGPRTDAGPGDPGAEAEPAPSPAPQSDPGPTNPALPPPRIDEPAPAALPPPPRLRLRAAAGRRALVARARVVASCPCRVSYAVVGRDGRVLARASVKAGGTGAFRTRVPLVRRRLAAARRLGARLTDRYGRTVRVRTRVR